VFVKQFGGSKGDPSGSAHITVEYGKKSEG
jgi:hypothetical protein